MSLAVSKTKSKPVNVFSNDGSFLERFQRSKQEEQDRHKAEETFTKKKHFADRFKNRGKRPPPPDSSPAVTSTDNPSKKAKLDDGGPRGGGRQKYALGNRVLKDTATNRK